MKIYEKTQSTDRPLDIEINPYKIFIAKNIVYIEIPLGEETETLQNHYEYDLYEYTPEEYIGVLQTKNNNLQQEVLDTQMALCDVYELLEG